MNWIPIDKELPQVMEPVTGYDALYEEILPAVYLGDFGWNVWGRKDDCCVTHWKSIGIAEPDKKDVERIKRLYEVGYFDD